jgi:hypothetical protein
MISGWPFSDDKSADLANPEFYRMAIPILSLAIALLVGGLPHCSHRQEASVHSAFELKVGEEAVVNPEGLTVRFDSVLEDSRCPKGVDCIWAGRARVGIMLKQGENASGPIELSTDNTRKPVFLGYRITLIRLTPYPTADSPIDKRDYVVTLEVSKE